MVLDLPPGAMDEPDLIALAREILSRMTPEERAEAAAEGERHGVSEESVILQALAQLDNDPAAGVAGQG